jgi:hypothetical protein
MPDIYHITHVDNLAGMIGERRLWCDAKRIQIGLASTNIGYSHIKARRMRRPVTVAAGGTLGDYVPFNFCSRSVMLYVVSRGHADYAGDQRSIVHLVSSVERIVETGRPCFFTDRHADLGYARQLQDVGRLVVDVDWGVMPVRQWGGDSELKEKRQAEFLVHEWCPWTAIREIGVMDEQAFKQVTRILAAAEHTPDLLLRRDWYY